MTTIQEAVAVTIAYKAESAFGTAAGDTGGKRIRRVTSTLNLNKDTFQSAEVRPDQQVSDMRHGTLRPAGRIDGELSITTYDDWLAALLRSSWVAGASLDESDFTSVTADNATNKFTFTAGDPIALGLRVGDIIRFGSLSVAANNDVNFRITGFGGTSNREVTVFPAPTDNTSDSAFTVVVQGHKVSFGVLRPSFTIEQDFRDVDLTERFLGARIGGASFALPPTGMATAGWDIMAQFGEILTGASSPYFTSPTDAPTTDLLTGVQGNLVVGGVAQAVVTGLEFAVNLNVGGNPVVGTTTMPELFYGRAVVTGQVSAFLTDETMINYFVNETAVDILVRLEEADSDPKDFLAFNFHRVKFTGSQKTVGGDGGVIVQFPFQALLKSGTGYDTSTMVIQRSY